MADRRRDAGRPRGVTVENAILDAALDDLAAHGLEGLSIARIAEAADVNKTSIYRRWPTKEELTAAALGRSLSDAASSMPDSGNLRGDLDKLMRHLEKQLSKPGGRALAAAAMAPGSSGAVKKISADQQSLTREAALGLVARAQERGEWDSRAAPAPDAVFAMIAGALMHRVLMERQPVNAAWRKTVLNVLCGGLRSPVQD